MTTTDAPKQQLFELPATGSLARVIGETGLPTGRPVVVLIGGAAKLDDSAGDLRAAVRDGVVATAQAEGATLVDGGTDSGVMALAGQAHRDLAATIPLVGVAPIGKIAAAGIDAARGTTPLEPNHTHLLLAPGDEWGSEAPFLVNAARILGGSHQVVAVLIDGGPLALQEAMACAAEGWSLITLAGSGRTADVLATYARGGEDRSLSSTSRGSIQVVDLAAGPAALADTLRTLLHGRQPVAARPKKTPSPRIEYPALYVVASQASRRGQQNYKRLSALELGLTLAALSIGLGASIVVAATTLPADVREATDAIVVVVVALFFLFALLVKFLERSSSYDDDWFHGRAIAETVKSLSWRYMLRVPPFDEADADDQLTAELASVLDAAATIRQAVDRLPARPRQISASMTEVRARELAERRDLYVNRRLLEQAHWYRQRSADHRRSATRWFWAAVVFQVLAVASALLALVAVALHGGADIQAPFVRAMSLLASLAIAVTAWTQLTRDDELAKTYAVALQDLLLIAGATERATSNEDFAAAVRDGEEAIGRENRVWVAKRSERHDSTEFGHAD